MKPTLPTLLVLSGCAAVALTVSSCGPAGDKKEGSSDAKSSATAPAADTAKKEAAAAAVPAGDLIDVKPNYPKPLFVGTPPPAVVIPNLEKGDPEGVEKRLTLHVPKGTTNVALNKKVTSSDPLPIIGTLDLVTDGDADGADGCYVELAPGKQWVQIDLGEDYAIWKILLWHFHKQPVVFFNSVVQVSDDPEFKDASKITTVFNNDLDNKNGLGKGTDMNYVETNNGRLIEGKGTKGRYLRLYSNGNSADEMNRYIEVQVYGTPAK